MGPASRLPRGTEPQIPAICADANPARTNAPREHLPLLPALLARVQDERLASAARLATAAAAGDTRSASSSSTSKRDDDVELPDAKPTPALTPQGIPRIVGRDAQPRLGVSPGAAAGRATRA
jgi:hypothetical protein